MWQSFKFPNFQITICNVYYDYYCQIPMSTFRFLMFSHVKFKTFNCSIFKFSICHRFGKIKSGKIKKLGTHTFQTFPNSRFSDMKNIFQGCPHIPCIFWSIFGDKYGVRGSIFYDLLEVPEIIKITFQSIRSHQLFWNK